MQPGSTSLILAVLLASSLSAQIGIGKINANNLPGDAVLPPGSINITAVAISSFGNDGTDLDDIHGVARLPNGHYVVSQGQNGGLVLKQYFELDANGNFLSSAAQPFINGAQGDIGLTDLAWDERTDGSSRVWAGRARGIMSYDWTNSQFDPKIVPGQSIGLHVLDTYDGAEIRAAAIAEIGGNKIFISSDNQIGQQTGPGLLTDVNWHVMGLPLPSFPVLRTPTPLGTQALGLPDFGKMGAAHDPVRNTIWWADDSRTNNPNPNHSAVRFIEMDIDGNLTGQVVQGIREIGGIARGCEMYIDAQGNPVMAYVVSMGTAATSPIGITFDQDILVEMYMGFQYGTSCGGDIAFQTEPYIGNLGWTITLKNAPAGAPAAFLARGRAASPPGVTLPGLLSCGLLIDLPSLNIEGSRPLLGGEASFIRTLPDLPGLVGAEAAFQWLNLSAIGGLPISPSDAGAVRIGTNL